MKIVATEKLAFADRFIPSIKNGMKKHTVRHSKQTVGKTIPFYDAYGVIPFDEKRITAIQDIVIDIDDGNIVLIQMAVELFLAISIRKWQNCPYYLLKNLAIR